MITIIKRRDGRAGTDLTRPDALVVQGNAKVADLTGGREGVRVQ
jgi:hypothetical protein